LIFSCNTPVQVLDINEIKEGEAMDKFTPYSFIKNSNLIMESFKATYKGAFDTNGFQDMLKRIAKYPDTITCK
jgi:hypothetical protein